ncbi:MAG TPA: hypothetical protein VGK58_20155 [Lacipirellulaceae bacterium]
MKSVLINKSGICSLVLLGILLVGTSAIAQQPQDSNQSIAVADLAASIERRFEIYDRLEFEYHVLTHATPSPEATPGTTSTILTDDLLDTVDELKILAPAKAPDDGKRRPLTSWIRRITDDNGTEVVDRFVAFDGTNSSDFRRRGRRPALFVPWEIWDDCNENVFEQFLFLRINGIPKCIDVTGEFQTFNLDRYQIVETKQVLGRTAFVLKAQGSNGNPAFDDIAYTVEVIGEPEFMVVRWQADDTKLNRPLLLFEVKEIKTIESIPYPAAGRYQQWAIGELPNHTYEFEVTYVKRLPDDAEQNWLPKWPRGTIVRDEITGKTFKAE